MVFARERADVGIHSWSPRLSHMNSQKHLFRFALTVKTPDSQLVQVLTRLGSEMYSARRTLQSITEVMEASVQEPHRFTMFVGFYKSRALVNVVLV